MKTILNNCKLRFILSFMKLTTRKPKLKRTTNHNYKWYGVRV